MDFILNEHTAKGVFQKVLNAENFIGIVNISNERLTNFKTLAKGQLCFDTIYTSTVHVAVSKNHPLAQTNKVSFSQLTQYRPIFPTEDAIADFDLTDKLTKNGVLPKRTICNNTQLLIETLLTTNQVIYILDSPLYFFSNELRNKLKVLPIKNAPEQHIVVLYHSNIKQKPLYEIFLEELKKMLVNAE